MRFAASWRPAPTALPCRRSCPPVPHATRSIARCGIWTPSFPANPPTKLEPVVTAYTLSLGSPDEMSESAARARHRPLIKIKLGLDGDAERLQAVREAAPDCRLIIDANEGWHPETSAEMFALCERLGVELIEQPFPAGNDEALRDMAHPVPVCADEAIHGLASLDAIADRYGAVNIKLDKTGGLTEALALCDAAEARGLRIMVGCMLATSLAMAPAFLVAQKASVVDLDGPLLLANDRKPGIRYEGSLMHPCPPELWG